LNIIESLKDEGLINEYEALLERFEISTEHFIKTKYSYRSEFPFDTTGYESTYFFRKFRKRYDLVNEIVKVLLASLHHQPIWWWYGCDIKSLGVYTTAMNSRCLLDAYEDNPDKPPSTKNRLRRNLSILESGLPKWRSMHRPQLVARRFTGVIF